MSKTTERAIKKNQGHYFDNLDFICLHVIQILKI